MPFSKIFINHKIDIKNWKSFINNETKIIFTVKILVINEKKIYKVSVKMFTT